VWYLYELLSSVCTAKPFIRYRYHPVTNRIYSAWEFRSNQIQAITYLRRIFYPNGVKIIPASIKPLFTSLSLAIIIMDDGTARDGGIRIQTNGFSVADVKGRPLTIYLELQGYELRSCYSYQFGERTSCS